MYNFIIVDDNKYFLNLTDKTIKKIFKQKGLKCNTYLFEDYNEDFFKKVYTYDENKVYILDIETPLYNGVDAAIRIRKNDNTSDIIFVSAYEEDYVRQILRSDVKYFCSFSKRDLEKNLTAKINKLLNQNSGKILSIKINNEIYQVSENDIYYIKYEDRKIDIIMKDCNLKLDKRLKDIFNILSDNFVYSHKSCIVNLKKIISYSLPKKEIVFENGTQIDLLSRKYKPNLDKYFK